MSTGTPVQPVPSDSARDAADLARFGYKQELKRVLGTFSSFAVAFSYISPSTGIFTLYALGLGFIGPAFFWTLPLALIPALNGLGWAMENSLENQRMVAVVTLIIITVLNIYGVRLVAIVNNTGVVF